MKINQKIHELFPLFKHCKIKLSANKVNEASEEFIDAILSISIENNINNIVIKLEKGSSAIINIITFLSLITGLLSLAGNLVLLMDTQTLGLDCNNQRQFCNYIYNYLSKDIQVLFTTNSPLMINLGRKESLYVVKYNKNLGSTADQKLDTADNNPSLSCYRYALKLVE